MSIKVEGRSRRGSEEEEMRFSVESGERPGDERPQLASCACSCSCFLARSIETKTLRTSATTLYSIDAACVLFFIIVSPIHYLYIDKRPVIVVGFRHLFGFELSMDSVLHLGNQ
ncbi:hypothetical protein BDV10DRAFT_19624 [Aspergillus recurvatus]